MLSQINIRQVKLFLAIVLIGIFQITVMPYFTFQESAGNLILVILVILVLKGEYRQALQWALFSGVILDLSLGIDFGINICAALLVFTALYFFEAKFLQNDLYIFALIAGFGASIFYDIIFLTRVILAGQQTNLLIFWPIILKQAALNTILVALAYPIYGYMSKKLFSRTRNNLPELSAKF